MYACPHCHKNERIALFVATWVREIGKFENIGADTPYLEPESDPESTTIGDPVDSLDLYYLCYSCNQKFNEPALLESVVSAMS